MADCADLKQGDTVVCESCGLELNVAKSCSCATDQEGACNAPLKCCGKEMVKK